RSFVEIDRKKTSFPRSPSRTTHLHLWHSDHFGRSPHRFALPHEVARALRRPHGAGFLLSILVTRLKRRPAGKFNWEWAFLGFWLGCSIQILVTGGLNSPVFEFLLAALLIGASVCQSRFTVKQILAFV